MTKSLEELCYIQMEIAKKVILEKTFEKKIKNVAGIDSAFLEDLAIVACVIIDYDSQELKTEKVSIIKLDFPYIPTFLSFREGPPIIDLIKKLDIKPDVCLINAHGVAHPRKCGCASYVGVLTGLPTIGVTARNLCGEYEREPRKRGEFLPIYSNELFAGWIFKSREDCRPIFVSPGHSISLQASLEIVMKCIKNHKLPEPLYLAHVAANRKKKKYLQ